MLLNFNFLTKIRILIKISNFFKKHYLIQNIFISILLALLIIIPRLLASKTYGPLEDELLAIQFNLDYPASELFFKPPDVTHPGLWYIIMEIPIVFLGYFSPIIYYRMINIIIFTLFIIITWILFSKKFTSFFWILFLTLLLSNPYLIHLTFQNRMYSLVLGINIIYSTFWLKILNKKINIQNKEILILGLLAGLGFFTNYSFIWILPIWPLAYLLTKRNKTSLKRMLKFALLFTLETFWFIPTFIKNANESMLGNRWAPSLNLITVKELIENYFGITNVKDILFFSILSLTIIPLIIKVKKRPNFLSLVLAFFFYLLVVFLTGNGLLYARVSITFVITLYVILANFYSKQKLKSKIILLVLPFIFLQTHQLVVYLNNHQEIDSYSSSWDYYSNPLEIITNYKFKKNSCIIGIPIWNDYPISYFLPKNLKLIKNKDIERSINIVDLLNDCSENYLLVQNTIPEGTIKNNLSSLDEKGLICDEFLENLENQDLYKCQINN